MIKRYFKSVLGQMFVLLGVAAMVACSSEKDEIVDNPNFNKETGEVNTQFVFSVSSDPSLLYNGDVASEPLL